MRWAEDVKFALERELREIDTLIKVAKKTSKSAVALAEKLEAQKLIKTLEAKRNTKRRQLFEAQDDVDRKRAELIEDVERQLQTKTTVEPVFTLRWTLSDGASDDREQCPECDGKLVSGGGGSGVVCNKACGYWFCY